MNMTCVGYINKRIGDMHNIFYMWVFFCTKMYVFSDDDGNFVPEIRISYIISIFLRC